ncbi:hypothetical protein HG530_011439 [Fusarium avenaceum]|nr:hypothetical protein HG530_011439 [Fusarium avenaceum]
MQAVYRLINVLLVHQHISVSGVTLLHIHNGLVGVLHGSLLNPRLDVLVNSELQHLLDVLGSADKAAAELEAALDQGEGVDGRKLARVGGSDLDEVTAAAEELEVFAKGHLGAGDGADDQVNGLGVLVGPALIVVGGDVGVGAESEHLVSLGGLAGDTDDLVSAEGLCEENTEVAETTDTDDADSLAGAAAVCAQGSVDCDTAAEHGSGELRGDAIGDLNDEAGVDGAVGADHLGAVVEAADGALAAVLAETAAGLGTYTDSVADLDVLDLVADADGLADDLVADTAGCFCQCMFLIYGCE